MKKLMILALSAALLTGMSSAVQAIDFKARGEWLMGFGAGDGQFTSDRRIGADSRKTDTDDVLDVRQRVKLQLDAVASESLSGTVIFEIGDQVWGQNRTGGALGADGNVV